MVKVMPKGHHTGLFLAGKQRQSFKGFLIMVIVA
jgi:hypothetical protein